MRGLDWSIYVVRWLGGSATDRSGKREEGDRQGGRKEKGLERREENNGSAVLGHRILVVLPED